MFEIKTFLGSHSYDNTDPFYSKNPEAKYVSLDDSLKLREYIDHRKFTPEHIQMLITIKYKNQIVVGIDAPSGLDLWEASYMVAMDHYLEEKKVEIMYGIDPILMKLNSIDSNLLEFTIMDEWKAVEVYATAVLPEKEFLVAILDGAEHFWKTLIDYKVFEEKEIRETTPKEYPKLMIEEIEKLREKIKALLN
ncbi:hypothetical protein [Peribacillus frigoritolerans]|uniref:hypothetical protein n=1 Tax=Peribacillus frigoritolerans TaxID=450367 RepID=UPI00105A0604|nr:hypothetical protein [Peribacillus frigoritolerans]TDL78543.1 hypothetical protein E2R53_13815 [Peribacillus frigoritolerans]